MCVLIVKGMTVSVCTCDVLVVKVVRVFLTSCQGHSCVSAYVCVLVLASGSAIANTCLLLLLVAAYVILYLNARA